MFKAIIFILNNKIIYNVKTCKIINFLFWKWSLAGLVFALCFTLAAVPVFAAPAGDDHLTVTDDGGSDCSAAQNSTGKLDVTNNTDNTGSFTITIIILCIVFVEIIVLGIILFLIVSDLRVIRWYERKKRRQV